MKLSRFDIFHLRQGFRVISSLSSISFVGRAVATTSRRKLGAVTAP
jgi:hypothetical protein